MLYSLVRVSQTCGPPERIIRSSHWSYFNYKMRPAAQLNILFHCLSICL